MKNWQSFTALKSVKTEIENLSRNLANALESVIVTPSDEQKILRTLHEPVKCFIQVPGTLRLMEYENLAILADEILYLLADTIRNEKSYDEHYVLKGLQLTFVAATDLPALVETSISSGNDDFADVFKQINQLRKGRNCAVIFNQQVLIEKRKVKFKKQFEKKPEKIREVVLKQQGFLDKASKALENNPKNQQAIATLKGVIHNLEIVFRDYRIGTLWGLAYCLMEIIEQSPAPNLQTIKLISSLQGKLDEIADQIDGSKKIETLLIDEKLFGAMLDVIAASSSSTPNTSIARLWYNLDLKAGKQYKQSSTAIQVKYVNKSSINKCLQIVNEDIKAMQDRINTIAESCQQEQVNDLISETSKITTVLEILRINYLAEHINIALASLPEGKPLDCLSQLARTLFQVSTDLSNKLDIMEHEIFFNETNITNTSNISTAVLNILLTSIKSMESVISGLDEFVEENYNTEKLVELQKTVKDLACVLETVPLNALAEQLLTARAFFGFLKEQTAAYEPDKQLLALSQLLINIMWSLEQMVIGRENTASYYLEKGAEKARELDAFVNQKPVPEATGLEDKSRESLTIINNDEGNQVDTVTVEKIEEEVSANTEIQGRTEVTPASAESVNDCSTREEDNTLTEQNNEITLTIDDEIQEIFIEELEEVFESLQVQLKELDQDPHNAGLLKDICRSFHTIKGSGRMVNAETISSLAYAMETLFDHLHSMPSAMNNDVSTLTSSVLSFLPELRNAFVNNHTTAELSNKTENFEKQAEQIRKGESISLVNEKEQDDDVDLGDSVDLETNADHAEAETIHAESLIDIPVTTGQEASDHSAKEEPFEAHSGQGKDEEVDEEAAIVANTFSFELMELNEKIRQIVSLDNENSSSMANTTDLVIPIHTLYGNARLQELTAYSAVVFELEKFLQKHSHQLLDNDSCMVISDFTRITDTLAIYIQDSNQIAEYSTLDEDAEKFKQALQMLSTSWMDTDFLETISDDLEYETPVKTLDSAETENISQLQNSGEYEGPMTVQELVISGFLNEARELVAKLSIQLKSLQNEPSEEAVAAISNSIDLLQGAADIAGIHNIEETCSSLVRFYEVISGAPQYLQDDHFQLLNEAQQHLENSITILDNNELPESAPELLQALNKFTNSIKHPTPAEIIVIEQEAVDPELLDVFIEEADELLHELDEGFLHWQQNPQEQNHIDEYLRLLHTLKGSAALVNEMQLSKSAHDYETFILNEQKAGNSFSENFFTRCDQRLHKLHDIFRLYQKDDSGHYVKSSPVRGNPELDKIEGDINNELKTEALPAEIGNNQTQEITITPQELPEQDTSKSATSAKVSTLPSREARKPVTAPVKERIKKVADEQIKVSSQLLRSLLNDADEINFSRSRIEKDFHDISNLLVDMDDTLSRLRSYVKKFEEKSRSEFLCTLDNGPVNKQIYDEFDSLELDRYTELQELSLSLTEDYEDLQDIRINLASKIKEIDNVLLGQQRLTNSLQDGLISSQMVPFDSVVPRFRRLVRQVSRELEKKVDFYVENQQGYLDKNVLQAIITPLEHIIRNALDHGIELPEERNSAGKAEKANLMIKVERSGASINIEIKDDGRGIDIDKIKSKASSKGLIEPDVDITRDQAYQLIFTPGFSTTDSVSNISGRGVGLDVVKNEITQIGGNIEVHSRPGNGTSFIFHLPLTSSLNRALLFEIQGTRYVVLMNTLDGVIVEKLGNIHHMQLDGDIPTFDYHDKNYEYLYLGTLLNEGFKPRLDTVDTSIPLLLVSGKDKNYALHIDSIVESRDLVVKSFGKQFASMPGVAGGVIMPDGNVAIVLELRSLVNLYSNDAILPMAPAVALTNNDKHGENRKLVMVVDDSITVRKITSTILERNSMDVITAKNGVEALELLETHCPDLILLDIEMPKMDGFEVASHIRKQEGPAGDIPIIMITSRIGDKHRTRAEEIGVNEYLCKPFQEDNLLEHISNY